MLICYESIVPICCYEDSGDEATAKDQFLLCVLKVGFKSNRLVRLNMNFLRSSSSTSHMFIQSDTVNKEEINISNISLMTMIHFNGLASLNWAKIGSF